MQVPILYHYLDIIDNEYNVCRVQPLYVVSWILTSEQKSDIYKYWFDSINNLIGGARNSSRLLEQFLGKPDPTTGQTITVSTSPPNGLKEQLDPLMVSRLSQCIKDNDKRYTAIPVFLIANAGLDIAPFSASTGSREGINPYSKEFIYYISNHSLIGHVVLLLIDKQNKEIELFDSSIGSSIESNFIPNLDLYLTQYLTKTGLVHNYTYYNTLDFCPLAVQEAGTYTCGYWVLYWLSARLVNKINRERLGKMLASESREFLREQITSFIADLQEGKAGKVVEYI